MEPAGLSSESATTEIKRAFAYGVCSWNHAAVRALFKRPAGVPVFCDDFKTALRDAKHNNGELVAWASRIDEEQVDACANANVALIRIEDGFLRSIGLGAGYVPAASLAIDHRGIYYDARWPSDIEYDLNNLSLTKKERQAGAEIRASIIRFGLSKYNLRRQTEVPILPQGRPIVLVPGQVGDDASIKSVISNSIDTVGENINIQLLRLARRNNPDAYIIYKPHPDVIAELRRGKLEETVVRTYADLVVGDVDILHLIDLSDSIETISSLAGFEALLRGKRVTVHGSPFYAGWGLTNDCTDFSRRNAQRSIDELTYIAFSKYTQHIDPLTKARCNVLELICSLVHLRESNVHRWRTAALLRIAKAIDGSKD